MSYPSLMPRIADQSADEDMEEAKASNRDPPDQDTTGLDATPAPAERNQSSKTPKPICDRVVGSVLPQIALCTRMYSVVRFRTYISNRVGQTLLNKHSLVVYRGLIYTTYHDLSSATVDAAWSDC